MANPAPTLQGMVAPSVSKEDQAKALMRQVADKFHFTPAIAGRLKGANNPEKEARKRTRRKDRSLGSSHSRSQRPLPKCGMASCCAQPGTLVIAAAKRATASTSGAICAPSLSKRMAAFVECITTGQQTTKEATNAARID